MSYEIRRIGDVIVNRVRIIDTERDVYSAWELTTAGEHYVITTFDDAHYGRIDTKDPPDEIEDLPRGKIRIRAVSYWYSAQKSRALMYIFSAFPEIEATPHLIGDGQVVLEGEPV
jgi:hypothetical protein